ncbi:MAG: aspartate--tRNA ligase [Chlamydiales bacterium]|nr:aspartate--tRNA ligase [Chlamydiales bacterium]
MVEFRRTHTCGALRKEHVGSTIRLSGWVHRFRDHGGLIFIDLRDRFGLTQLVFDPVKDPKAHEVAQTLRSEWVITIEGNVHERMSGMSNANLPTGEVEIFVHEITVLSKAKTPPFSICDDTIDVNEELRLRYRYLDMRRGDITEKMITRHKCMMATREFLDSQGFLEINTPILGKSTPEGARDYLVPSRIYPGSFYALPQSPQLFKQLLMVGGLDRYFQIAPCFRDEDLRAERQPEFHQIDIEMSFSTTEDLFAIVEGMVKHVFKKTIGADIPTPFRHVTYRECVERYGTDKPDMRFGMELIRLDDLARDCSFGVFQDHIKVGNCVKGFCVKGGADITRKMIDEYTSFVSQLGVMGLSFIKHTEGNLSGGIAKFFTADQQQELIRLMNIEPNDLVFIVADTKERTNQSLDHLRRKVARDRNLIPDGKYEFLWVTEFPLFAWDADDGRIVSEHHPFTSPNFEDFHLVESEPLKVRSLSYDLVLNGYEIASGSQRIHDSELQHKIFEILRFTPEQIEAKFGFFVRALGYGTPPHIGVALGFDRLNMILSNTDNIRDVVAFPKTQKAADVMMESPSPVADAQLKELHLV